MGIVAHRDCAAQRSTTIILAMVKGSMRMVVVRQDAYAEGTESSRPSQDFGGASAPGGNYSQPERFGLSLRRLRVVRKCTLTSKAIEHHLRC